MKLHLNQSKMDPFSSSNDQRHKIETRWDRIEKRHINSAQIFDHSNSTATEICENLIQNHEFVTGDQMKAMLGEKSKQSCMNPNLVMDLRHSRVSFQFHIHSFREFFFQLTKNRA